MREWTANDCRRYAQFYYERAAEFAIEVSDAQSDAWTDPDPAWRPCWQSQADEARRHEYRCRFQAIRWESLAETAGLGA